VRFRVHCRPLSLQSWRRTADERVERISGWDDDPRFAVVVRPARGRDKRMDEERYGSGTAVAAPPEASAQQASEAEPEWETSAGIGGLLMQVVADSERDAQRLERELDVLAETWGAQVYSQFLFMLAHLRFTPAEAERHWRSVLNLHQSMSKRLEAKIDIRVALVSYFVDVSRRIKSPKVIELQLFRKTQASAYKDALTGLYNYRYFREHLEREIRRCELGSTAVSLVMVDIDDFKLYNDRNGHQLGNQTLSSVAQLVGATLQGGGVAIRYGGEEFALLLPSTTKNQAAELAERVRRRIAGSPFPGQAMQPGGSLTVSLGIATYPGDAASGEELVARADEALYLAKSLGKDRVVLYGQNYRSHRRVSATLKGMFSALEARKHSLDTVNISEAGVLFVTDAQVAAHSLLDVRLHLPDGRATLHLLGKVVRVDQDDSGRYQVAVRTVDVSPQDRNRLVTYLRQTEPEAVTTSADTNGV
jgi:diguanylate cyclase (GGDEF)-like protein